MAPILGILIFAFIAIAGMFALNPNELFSSASGVGSGLRVHARTVQTKEFAAGTLLLPKLYPVAFNTSTKKWVPWVAGTAEVTTLSDSGTVSGGTAILTIQGVAVTINWNSTVAQTQAAIDAALLAAALLDYEAGDIVVSGATLPADQILTFGGSLKGTDTTCTVDNTSITGGGTLVATQTTQGATGANGTSIVKGFVWPDPIQLDSDEEVLGVVLMEGQIHIGDVPDIDGTATVGALKKVLRDSTVRSLGIIVQGLTQFR